VDLPALDAPRLAPGAVATTGEEWRQEHPSWVYQALLDGQQAERPHARGPEGRTYAVAVHALGEVPLPDGRVVACDPLTADAVWTRALEQVVAPGTHPAGVGVVTIDEGHRRPGTLFLVTGSAPIVRWELGTFTPDADVAALPPGEFFGYGVDAGTGALCSPDVVAVLDEVGEEDDGALEDPLNVALDASDVDAACVAPREGALAVAACRSGWGDGSYATWIGHAADGSVSVVMSDFDLLRDPSLADPEADDPAEPTSAPPAAPAEPTAPAESTEPAEPTKPARGIFGRILRGAP